MKVHSSRGFTLIELMVTVVVLVILATVALPSLRSTLQNNRMTSEANSFLTAFQLARTEAIRRGAPVSVCASSDGATCTGSWESGWIVFVDGNSLGDGSATVDEVLQVWGQMAGDASNEGDDPDFVRFSPNGSVDLDAGIAFPVTFQLEIPDCTADNNRNLEIGPTGRATVSRVACS